MNTNFYIYLAGGRERKPFVWDLILLKNPLVFTIELVPGAAPSSKAPYRMNILELNELTS